MISDIEQPTTQPLLLTPSAIDLLVYRDNDGGDQVVMRVIDTMGVQIDVVMQRRHAAAFGISLADFAS